MGPPGPPPDAPTPGVTSTGRVATGPLGSGRVVVGDGRVVVGGGTVVAGTGNVVAGTVATGTVVVGAVAFGSVVSGATVAGVGTMVVGATVVGVGPVDPIGGVATTTAADGSLDVTFASSADTDTGRVDVVDVVVAVTTHGVFSSPAAATAGVARADRGGTVTTVTGPPAETVSMVDESRSAAPPIERSWPTHAAISRGSGSDQSASRSCAPTPIDDALERAGQHHDAARSLARTDDRRREQRDLRDP